MYVNFIAAVWFSRVHNFSVFVSMENMFCNQLVSKNQSLHSIVFASSFPRNAYMSLYIKIYIVTWCLKARTVEPEEASITRQQLSKQVSAATDTQAAVQELLGMMFSVWSMWSGNKRRELVNWVSVGSWAVMRRLYMCCSTVIFGMCNSLRLL
jgi:hypothetical protein